MTFSVVPRDKQQVLALVETELGSYRRVLCPLWRLCSRCSQPHHPLDPQVNDCHACAIKDTR